MTGRVGQNGHPAAPAAARLPRASRGLTASASLVAAGLLAAVGLSACGTDVAKADTVLGDPRAVTMKLADGSTSTPRSGTKVPKGATVLTATGGSATLSTAGRVVILGSDTAVTVIDGRREQLRRGLVMVDARRAGDLQLDAGAATVSTPKGALTRVERGVLLRVASFRQDAVVRATGRKAAVTVTSLHQVQVPAGGLPGRVTALGLTLDNWERRYARDLVTDDIDLSSLAVGLDRDPTSGGAVATALPASYAAASPAPAGLPASEQSLGYLIAQAADKPSPATFAEVRRLRDEGGSWGVVAALVGSDVAAVSAALDDVVTPVEIRLALDAAQSPADVGGVPGVTSSDPTPAPGSTNGPGGGQPTRSPSPSASPSPSPSGPVPDQVDEVVDAIVSALPVPVPVPSSSALALPVPTTSVTVPALDLGVSLP